MKTIKEKVADLLAENLTTKKMFEKLTAEGVKTTLNTINFYRAKIKKANILKSN
jgi:endonuclease III-like uncharacterized protein